jgi:hypothetical protein
MPRQNTGTVRILKGPNGKPQWHGKWTLAGKGPDGKPLRSEWEPLDPNIALDDEAGAKAYAAKLAPSIRNRSAQLRGMAKSETVKAYAKRGASGARRGASGACRTIARHSRSTSSARSGRSTFASSAGTT